MHFIKTSVLWELILTAIREVSDYVRQDEQAFMEKHLKRRPAIVKPDEVFDYYEIDAADLQEGADHEET